MKDDWIIGAGNDTCAETIQKLGLERHTSPEKCSAKAGFIRLGRFELQDPDSTETSDLESLITEVPHPLDVMHSPWTLSLIGNH